MMQEICLRKTLAFQNRIELMCFETLALHKAED